MITVHGLLGAPTPRLRAEASRADLVVGGARHLDALNVPAPRRVVLGTIGPAIDAIQALPADAETVVVASGDPLLFGVVRRLRAAGLRPVVVPAPSSVQAAFSAVGLPWDDAVIVTAHGHDPRPALAVCRAMPKVAVLTDPRHGIVQLADGLGDAGRVFVLAERLGETDQRVRVLTHDEASRVDEVRQPNVVLVLAHHPGDAPADDVPVAIAGHRPVAVPDVSFVAATVFGRLLPTIGELVWVAGPVGFQAGELAAANGAAVIRVPHGADLTGLPLPDVVVSHESSVLTDAGQDLRAFCLVEDDVDEVPGFLLTRVEFGATPLTFGRRP